MIVIYAKNGSDFEEPSGEFEVREPTFFHENSVVRSADEVRTDSARIKRAYEKHDIPVSDLSGQEQEKSEDLDVEYNRQTGHWSIADKSGEVQKKGRGKDNLRVELNKYHNEKDTDEFVARLAEANEPDRDEPYVGEEEADDEQE